MLLIAGLVADLHVLRLILRDVHARDDLRVIGRAEVRVVGGTAPEALDGLPDPDAVFVGGGGLAVVSAVAARRPARIVVALAAVERAGPALEALADAGYTVDGTLLQASRLACLPDGAHRLAPANPVFLLWAARDHDHGQLGAP